MKKIQQSSTHKTGISFKLLTILMVIIAGCLIYLKYNDHQLLSNIRPEEKAYVMEVEIENNDSALIRTHEGEEPLVDSKDHAELELLEKELNEKISAEISENFTVKPSTAIQLDKYRLLLAQVMRLAEKFSTNKDYVDEAEFLQRYNDNYPSEISHILNLFEDYREKYLMVTDSEYKALPLEGGLVSRIVNRIIHIEQKNPQHRARLEAYNTLKSKLPTLENYFYSKEFLTKYFGND